MKIISKYKDYYDFCAGKFGIDERIIYDRTEFAKPSEYKRTYLIGFCGTVFRVILNDGDFIFGDEFEKDYWYSELKRRDTRWFLRGGHLTKTDINDKENCPVVLLNEQQSGLAHDANNPILKDLGFHKIMSPEDCWINISNWLSREKTITDNRTDKEKIVGHGFDLKTSFRKM